MNNIIKLSHSKAKGLAICPPILVRHWLWAASGMGGIASWESLWPRAML